MLFALARFDARVGNQIVWTSEPVDFAALPGLEFKMIPGGLHDRESDTIYFVCGKYYGVSVYESRIFGPPGSREDTRMFSLAALDTETLPWNQESYLQLHLSQFLGNIQDFSCLPTKKGTRPSVESHPMHSSTQFVQYYGANIFNLWKFGLSRSRVLLASLPGVDVKTMCQFAYIAHQLSAIPEDVADLLPARRTNPLLLYNVTVNDLQKLQSSESFWATTTEALLLSTSRDACDVFSEAQSVVDVSLGSPGRHIWPAWRDRRRLRRLVESLKLDEESNPLDPSFMRSSSHSISASSLNMGGSASLVEDIVDATASGLMWWASAGESALIDHEEAAEVAALLSPVDSPPGLSLLGQFQQYTRQFIRVFSRIAQDGDGVIRIGMGDIAAMGLDPFANSDREFLQRFALKWWDRPVSVGGGCCC